MVEVELVDDEPPVDGSGPDPAGEWLRHATAADATTLRRVVASRADGSLVVLG